jgi:pyruvate/2-oxoglutarate dehydrogenase complex dihydrolipoamide dehydrogenase (E3) component
VLVLGLHADQDDAARAGGACRGPAHARRRDGAGLGLDLDAIFDWRDANASGRDDKGQLEFLKSQNADFLRGDAVVVAPGLVRVADRELNYDKLVIATPLLGVD